MPNLAALRAAVFPRSAINLKGGAEITPPAVRVLMVIQNQAKIRMAIPATAIRDAPAALPSCRVL